jgi:hypothetical protein
LLTFSLVIERVFVYDPDMNAKGVDRLREAVDELAGEVVTGLSQRDAVVALAREMSRLDAKFARRLTARGPRRVGWRRRRARRSATRSIG